MRGDATITPSSRCTALGRVKPELIGLPRKALKWDAKRRFRFVVHTAVWLHSMVLHGQLSCVFLFTCVCLYVCVSAFDDQSLCVSVWTTVYVMSNTLMMAMVMM